MQKTVNAQIAGWWAPLFGALAGLVYWLTMSVGPFPGESATLIVNAAGLAPSPSMANPLWMLVAGALSKIPIGALATRLNLLSVVCGGLSVGLAFRLASYLMYRIIDAEVTDNRLGKLLSWLAGASTSLFLAFCMSFWIVSNRAHTASFDMMLMLGVTLMCLRYERTLALTDLCLCLFLYAVGMAEFATFIVFSPLFALFVMFQLWVHSEMNARTISASIGSFFAGLMLYGLAAWRFTGSELHQLQWPVTGFWDVLVQFWRYQHGLILHSLPGEGWLLITIVTIVPWLTMLLVAQRSLNASADLGQVALHLVMTVIAVLVLFSGHFSLLAKLGVGRLLVTPYLLIAMVYGYLSAYWCLMLVMLMSGPRWGSAGRARVAEAGCVIVFVGMALAGAILNVTASSTKGASVINRYAGEVVKQVGDRNWLITRGELDSSIRVVAHENGKKINIVNLSLAGNDLFLRYMASLFENPRIKALADVGLIPMLTEWFKSQPGAVDDVAITVEADVWGLAGRHPVPRQALYDGVVDNSLLDAGSLMDENRAFWTRMVVPLIQAGESHTLAQPMAIVLLREISRKANNLGVLMEDLGKQKEAYEAYTKADEVVPGNISALLNRYAMIQAGYAAADSTSVTQAVESLMATTASNRSMSAVVQMYGTLRSPASLASMGLNWRRLGYPSLGVQKVKDAISVSEGAGPELPNILAEIYLTQAKPEESEAIYLELLTHHPEDGTPYLGLARVAAAKGDHKRAEEMLKRAEKTGVPSSKVLPEQAALLLAEGKLDVAGSVLSQLLNIDSNSVRALTLQAAISIRTGNLDDVRKNVVPRLMALKQPFAVGLLNAEMAMKEGDLVKARMEMEGLHDQAPSHLPVLEALVNLDFMEGRKDDAANHVKRLLGLAPDHAMGNYILAKLQMERREYALAESSLRRALHGRRAIAVLNDLAYVLLQRQAYEEGESLVREAITINPKLYQFHDTLAQILAGERRFSDAQKEFELALSLSPDEPSVLIHLAQLYMAQEKRSEASELMAMLQEKKTQLSSAEQVEMDRLEKDLE